MEGFICSILRNSLSRGLDLLTVFFVFGYGKSSAVESVRLSLALEEERLFGEELLAKPRHARSS
jgi:hypothetical protein